MGTHLAPRGSLGLAVGLWRRLPASGTQHGRGQGPLCAGRRSWPCPRATSGLRTLLPAMQTGEAEHSGCRRAPGWGSVSTRPPRSFLLADQLHPGALGTFHRDAAPESTSAQPHRDPHCNLGACLPAPPSAPRTRHPWPLGPTGLRPWSVPGAGLRPPAVSEVVSWVTTAQVTTARSRASAEVPLVKEALGGASLSWGLPGPCLPPFSCPPQCGRISKGKTGKPTHGRQPAASPWSSGPKGSWGTPGRGWEEAARRESRG